MKKLILIELDRVKNNKMMWFSLMLGMVIAIVEFIIGPLASSKNIISGFNGNVNSTIKTVFNTWMFSLDYRALPIRKLYVMIMPLLATFAYSTSIVSDIKTGYIKNIYIRTKKINYLVSKCIVSHIAGGMVVVIPIIVNLLLTSMVLPSVKPEAVLGIYEPGGYAFLSEIAYTHPYIYIFIFLIIIFLYSGIFTSCSLLVAEFAPVSFIAAIFPFVFNYFCYVLMGSFGLGLYNPMRIMTIGYSANNTLLNVVLEWLVVETIIIMVYLWKGIKSETV